MVNTVQRIRGWTAAHSTAFIIAVASSVVGGLILWWLVEGAGWRQLSGIVQALTTQVTLPVWSLILEDVAILAIVAIWLLFRTRQRTAQAHAASRMRAKARLLSVIDRIDEVKRNHGDLEFTKWREDARNAIRYAFGEQAGGRHIERFDAVRYRPGAYVLDDSVHHVFWQARNRGLDEARGVLCAMVDELEHYSDDAG